MNQVIEKRTKVEKPKSLTDNPFIDVFLVTSLTIAIVYIGQIGRRK